MQALAPVSDHLIAPLTEIYRDHGAQYTQAQQHLATSVLESYAADSTAVLADLIMDAKPAQFATLFPKLALHGEEAARLLSNELAREVSLPWGDAPVDPDREKPNQVLTAEIQAAQGLLEERYALCQTMPLNRFLTAIDALGKSGYRPTRFRPFASKGGVLVSAVWACDGRDWRLVHGLTAEEIRQRDHELQHEGLVPVDVAGYLADSAGEHVERYGGVWVEQGSSEEETRMYAGASATEHQAVHETIAGAGFKFQHALQAFRGLDGQQRYSGVMTRSGGLSATYWNLTPARFEHAGELNMIPWDLDISNAATIPESRDRSMQSLAHAEARLKQQPGDLNARSARAQANFELGNDQEALGDFDLLIEKAPGLALAYQYRAMLHARAGRSEAAQADVKTFKGLSQPDSLREYLEAAVAVYLGNHAKATRRLEKVVNAKPTDHDLLYAAACAYAIAAKVIATSDPPKSKAFAKRAVALLRQAVRNGYRDYLYMSTDPDLNSLRGHPEFETLLAAGQLDRRYAAVWQISTKYESVAAPGFPLPEHLARCREFASQDYRPTAISTAAIGADATLVAASVWHRVLVAQDDKEILARRQANAAVALVRMSTTEKVWPLLKHRPDPRVRSWLIHRLSLMGADPEVVAKRLADEHDVSIRRALILGLGEYDDISPVNQQALAETLLGLYRDDPDPGIHGAAEWSLRRWGKEQELAAIDAALTTGKVEGARRWYLNGQGQTMVLIRGPVEFLMGSPATEPDRQTVEIQHRRRIGRDFALGSKEVTVEQFQRFLRATPSILHAFTQRDAPEPDCPEISVTWYEAAAYCRWLSEKEGIPENQMCYPAVAEIREGMRLPADYLSRTGYRLPSEAEWEYACRAGAHTSRPYGHAEELLHQYAWYPPAANNRSWPVARLKPNDLGFFDMLGNAVEWCQDGHAGYRVEENNATIDSEDTALVTEEQGRVLRGGGFTYQPPTLRCAIRLWAQPSYRAPDDGFRLARTHARPIEH